MCCSGNIYKSAFIVLVFFGLVCLHAGAAAYYTIEKKLDHGQDASLYVWVILAEGYTEGQAEQFQIDAAGLIDAFISTTPFKEYKSALSIYTIFTPSDESGADHPSEAHYVDTAFEATYDTYGISRLLTVNEERAFEAAAQIPYFDVVFVLVNDEAYGGSGGAVIVVSTHKSARDIALHEAGHVIGKLADEYETPYPEYPEGDWEPNVTYQDARGNIPWQHWIETDTPVPTPEYLSEAVGLFEGARYQPEGIYRSTLTSKMRSLNQPFFDVCSEALILNIYTVVNPIQRFGPEESDIQLTAGTALTLWIEPLNLEASSYDVVWEIDEEVLEDESNMQLTLLPSSVTQGHHAVSAWISDVTDMVKTDSQDLLTSRQTWNIVKDFCSGKLSVRVVDAETDQPVADATVIITDNDIQLEPNQKAVHELTDITCGTYTLLAEAADFEDGEQTVSVQDGAETSLIISLTALEGSYYITGNVTGEITEAVSIKLTGAAKKTVKTNAAMAFVLGPLKTGQYTLTPQATGYRFSPSSRNLTIENSSISAINFNARRTAQKFFISGSIQGDIKREITIATTGTQQVTTKTDSQGYFKLKDLAPGTYVLKPDYPGVTFEPVQQKIKVPEENVEGVLFAARETACAATAILPQRSNRLKEIRRLRDTVLLKSKKGRSYIQRYYKASPEISAILQRNKELKRTALQTLSACMPSIKMLLNGQAAELPDEAMIKIEAFAGRLSSQASPQLQKVIKQTLKDLRQPNTLQQLIP